MADDSDSAVAPSPEPQSPEGVIDWDKIHNLSPESAFAPPPQPFWSMVAIRNASKIPPVVFPPINHENLLISVDPPTTVDESPRIHTDNRQIPFTDSDLDSDSESNSSTTFSPSGSSPAPRSPIFPALTAANTTAIAACDATRRFDTWTWILYSKMCGLARFLSSGVSSSRGVFVTFRSAAFAAILMAFLHFRRRRRLRAAEEHRTRLIGIFQERDEKINRLLEQISQMNQMLLKLHRGGSGIE